MSNRRIVFKRAIAAQCGIAIVVAWAVTSPESVSGQVYFGMSHTAEGGAVLEPQADDTLIVSNIGSSGLDGVRVAVGESNGWWAELDFATSTNIACETIVCKMQRVELALAGPVVEEIGFQLNEQPGGRMSLTPSALNLSIGCTTVRIENNGQLIGQRKSIDSTSQLLLFKPDGTPVRCSMWVHDQPSPSIFPTSWSVVLEFVAPVDVTLSGQPTQQATRINILYEGHTGDTPNPLYEEAAVNASNSGTDPDDGILHLHAEGIVHRDIACRASGSGQITGTRLPEGGGLTVSNIGSSGLDGVCYVLPEIDDEVLCLFSSSNPLQIVGALPAVALMLTKAELDVLPGVIVPSTIVVADFGGGVQIGAHFDAAYGASNALVEVFDGGTSVGSVVVPLNPGDQPTPLGGIQDVAQVTVEKFHVKQEFGPTQGTRHRIGFPGPVEFTPFGLPPMIGDEIQVTPDGPAVVIDIHAFDLFAQNVPPFTIVDLASDLSDDPQATSFGIEHEDIGGATTSMTPEGHLVVSNIGSSGCDGVSIDIGEVDGWCGELDFGQRGGLLPGMLFDITTRDALSNPINGFFFEETGGGSAVGTFVWWDIDKPINVRLFSGTSVVDNVSHPQSGGPIVLGNIGSSGKDGVSCCVQYRETDFEFLLRLPSPQLLTLEGSAIGPVTADGLIITLPIDPVIDPLLRIVDLTAGNTPSFSILNEGLRQFGNTHRAVDDAGIGGFLCGETDHLIVSNIGSSGCDGVSIDLGDLDSDNDGIPVGFARVGEAFILDGSHSTDDAQVQTFEWKQTSGPFVFSSSSGQFDPATGLRNLLVNPDPEFASGTLRVDVLLDGAVQSSASGLSPGHVATVHSPLLPDTYAFELTVSDNVGLRGVGHRFTWDSATDFSTGGPLGGTVSGDEVQISWETSDESNLIDEMQLLSSASGGGGTVVLNGEQVVNLCPADLAPDGGDGVVNVQDLLFLLASWGTPAADTNGDDTTNVTDLLALLAAWGSCAP